MTKQRRRVLPQIGATGVAGAAVVALAAVAAILAVLSMAGGQDDLPRTDTASAPAASSSAETFGATMHPFADESYVGASLSAAGELPALLVGGVPYEWDASAGIGYPAGVPDAVDPSRSESGGVMRSTGGNNPQSIYGAFHTSAQRFAIRVNAWTAGDVTVYVDGRPVGSDPLIVPAGEAFVEVSGLSGEPHEVHFVLGAPIAILQVIVPSGETIRALDASSSLRVGIVGDSYVDVGLAPNYAGLVREIHRLTGWTVVQLGQGSTGYKNDGSSSGNGSLSPYGSPSRLAALRAADVDALIVVGSTNDVRTTSGDVDGDIAAASSAAAAYYASVSDIPTVVVGPEPISVSAAPGMTSVWNRLNEAVLAAARAAPGVVGVVDWRGEEWLTGTGSVSDPHGDGNQDVYLGLPDGSDTVHPNYAGNRYLAERLIAAIAPMPLNGEAQATDRSG